MGTYDIFCMGIISKHIKGDLYSCGTSLNEQLRNHVWIYLHFSILLQNQTKNYPTDHIK